MEETEKDMEEIEAQKDESPPPLGINVSEGVGEKSRIGG